MRNSVNSDELNEVAYNAMTQMFSSDEKISHFTSELNSKIAKEQPQLQGKPKRLTNIKIKVGIERLELMKSVGSLKKGSSVLSETVNEIDKRTKYMQELEEFSKLTWPGSSESQERG